MTDFDKMTTSIEKLQANSEYNIPYNSEVNEALFNSITWVSINNLSWSQVQAEMDRLNEEYDNQEYARKRKAAYPDIYDYMDGIVKNDQTQIDKYIADSQAVKVRYPKG